MKRQFTAACGLSAVLVASMLGFAGPAGAADDETESWEMPDVTGGTLAAALSSVASLSEDTQIPTGAVDMGRFGRQVLSPANWTVCATSPQAGEEVTAANGVLFGVVRYQSESCG